MRIILSMANINQNTIFFMEKNIRGAWVVYGIDGIKQYYGYTKAQARKKYIEDCKTIVVKR